MAAMAIKTTESFTGNLQRADRSAVTASRATACRTSCCSSRLKLHARATSGHAVLESAITLMKSRRRIAFPKAHDFDKIGLQCGRSNQKFSTRGIGFNCQFALQKFRAAHVGSRSETTFWRCPCDVRFSPNIDRKADIPGWQISADCVAKVPNRETTISPGDETSRDRRLIWPQACYRSRR